MDYVTLHWTQPQRFAGVRELTGAEEQAISGIGTQDAIRLLDCVLVQPQDSGLEPVRAAGLVAADRDRLLAALYIKTFGDRIDHTLLCPACAQKFDLNFKISELQSGFIPHVPEQVEQLPGLLFRLPQGCCVRLPSGADECAIAGLPPETAGQALLQRCLAEPGQGCDPEQVFAVWDALTPAWHADLEAQCPECGQTQTLTFDLQSYLLAALQQEQAHLIRDVHALARNYGWSLDEILSLPRSQRQLLVRYIESERAL